MAHKTTKADKNIVFEHAVGDERALSIKRSNETQPEKQ